MSNEIHNKLDKIDEKIEVKTDKLDARLDQVEKHLIVYNEQLKIHIEGVRTLKEENSLLEQYINLETEKIRKDLKPIVEHVQGLEALKKLLTTFSIVTTITGALIGIVYTLGLMVGWWK